MINICVDIGNTAVKTGIFKEDVLVHSEKYDMFLYENIRKLIRQYKVKNIILADVNRDAGIHGFASETENCLILTPETPVPIENQYASKKTLGLDRLAAAVGASYLFPGSKLLIIDAGTTVTYEYVSAEGTYLGGNISPGLGIRFRALHQFTGKLPLCRAEVIDSTIGNDTNSAIVNGVMNGILYEIQHYVESFLAKNKDAKIILTGGDTNHFDNCLKNRIFVEPNLTLIGLNRILTHNIQ